MSTPTGDPGQQPYGGEQPGQYGAAGYPAGGGGAQPVGPPKNGLGVTALVLGIIGLILAVVLFFFPYLGGVLGLLAIIFGIIGMNRAKKGEATNRGVAIGGLVTGILAVIVAIVITIVAAIVLSRSGAGDYFQCIQQAGQDQAAQQECTQKFQQQLQQQGSN